MNFVILLDSAVKLSVLIGFFLAVGFPKARSLVLPLRSGTVIVERLLLNRMDYLKALHSATR